MGARILVIEDTPANLELMRYLLSAFGHTVLTAVNGSDGIALAQSERPDLVVCDIQLPVLDGYQVAKALKSDRALASIPLVAVTALAMVGDRDRIVAAGFDGYISKPITPETFVQQIEAHLGSVPDAGAPPPGPQDAPAGRAAFNPRTLLAVDDRPLHHELARSIFEPHGYRVITASNMSEALVKLRVTRCDLILSDVCMSGATGFDFLEAVRADAGLRDIPFVFLTATRIGQEDAERGLALGASRFLRRPMDPQELLAEIENCLDEKGS